LQRGEVEEGGGEHGFNVKAPSGCSGCAPS
jgi:hypothetical protein